MSDPTTDHRRPASEADRQARAAFRLEAARRGGYRFLADRFAVSAATCRAICRGERDVPPGLAREIAADLRESGPLEIDAASLADRALLLDLWADERTPASKPGQAPSGAIGSREPNQ